MDMGRQQGDSGDLIAQGDSWYAAREFKNAADAFRKAALAKGTGGNPDMPVATRKYGITLRENDRAIIKELPFKELLEHSVNRSVAGSETLALVKLRISDYSQIMETFGKEQGKTLGERTFTRLKESIRASDIAVQDGDSAFYVILHGLHDAEAAEAVAKKLDSALKVSMDLAGHPYRPAIVSSLAVMTSAHIGADELLAAVARGDPD